MSNVAAAATKAATDPSTNGLLSKTSSQGGDAGAFARALFDADEDVDTSVPQADADEASPAGSDGASPTPRFSALKELASLGSKLQIGDATTGKSTPGATPASVDPATALPAGAAASTTGPSPGAQTLPGVVQSVGQQLDPQAAVLLPQLDPQAVLLPQQAATQTDKIKDTLPVEWQTGDAGQMEAGLDLGKLAAAISALKGPSSALAGKEEVVLDPAADEATADGLADAAPIAAPADGQMASSASATALLQMMANATGLAPQAAPALGSATGTAPVAAVTGEADGLDMPDGTEDDAALDFLTPNSGSADVADAKPFRFQKAGDAAVAISLSITRSEAGGAEMHEAIGATDTPDMITVLDNRRYLGFGMGSNASNLLSAASGDSDWAAAMHPASSLSNAASASSTGSVVNTLKLQLTPDHLGTVTANMRLQGDELSIHLTVHNAAAYRELSDDSKPMLEALRAQGFNVDQVTVSLSSAADPNSNSSSGQPQTNSNAHAQQQQLPRDGEAARQQAQGDGQGRSSGQADTNDMETRNDTAVEASGRGSVNAGSVYL
jgi:chemotaxis protein MotD